ncbi:PilZ domain-containing protein [Motilimonas pumila]|uniref:Flagellar brake protein n=1 Tax=Motilimonas pumila TaxID=2303987 RepID=A0A418YCQ6_9GAMM|nr:flagellar brake protein [Motilimonas pumila]RJG42309.1 flagellar brake protein [Motilimonas pumila]
MSLQYLQSLTPGMMLHVEAVTPAGIHDKMKLPLIGMLANEYLLLEYPEAAKWGDKFEVLKEGYDVVVRVLIEGEEGAVMAFKSTIMPTVSRPSKMLVLAYPQQVQKQPLRAEPRLPTRLPARVQCGDNVLQAQLLDLSASGCRVQLADPIKQAEFKGQKISILLESAQQNPLPKLLGVACNQKQENGRWSLGVKLDAKAAPKIEKLFQQMLVKL